MLRKMGQNSAGINNDSSQKILYVINLGYSDADIFQNVYSYMDLVLYYLKEI